MSYQEAQYWNQRENPNSEGGWSAAALNPTLTFLEAELEEDSSILEFGPGVGRTFFVYAYITPKKLYCYDITDRYRNQLIKRADDLEVKVDNFLCVHKVKELPYGDNQFDTTVACQVLLHQRPENIKAVMYELARVSDKVVCVAGLAGSAEHVFNHDYKQILIDIGCKLTYYMEVDNQAFFTYSKGDKYGSNEEGPEEEPLCSGAT